MIMSMFVLSSLVEDLLGENFLYPITWSLEVLGEYKLSRIWEHGYRSEERYNNLLGNGWNFECSGQMFS